MGGLAGDSEAWTVDELRYRLLGIALSALYGKHFYQRIIKKEAD